jgi:hypothetical protein
LFGFGISEWLGDGLGLGFRQKIGESGLILMGFCGGFSLEVLATGGSYSTDGFNWREREFGIFFIGAGVRSMN